MAHLTLQNQIYVSYQREKLNSQLHNLLLGIQFYS